MIERDSIGEIHVPDDVYYGSYTARSQILNATPYRATQSIPEYIKTIYFVKKCAAQSNKDLGYLPENYADAIIQAAQEGMEGKFNSSFIVDLYQGNGDVSTVMNINEILAKRANEILTGSIAIEPVKPNDHVSCNQATTDVLMSSAHITCHKYLSQLQAVLAESAQVFAQKSQQHKDAVRCGRTELRDALPVTFGQNFKAYHDVLARIAKQADEIKEKMLHIPMGGTAFGSGIGSVPAFAPAVVKEIAKQSSTPFYLPSCTIDAIQNCDAMFDVATYQEKVAAVMSKIAKDIRILSSGPNAGFAELYYPPIIPGSVTLPGKTNPTIEELIMRINMRVAANTSMAAKCLENAELEYNYLETLMNLCVMESFVMMTPAYNIILEYCFKTLEINAETGKKYAESTGALTIILTPLFGYAVATKIGIKCYRENMTIADAVVEEGLMSREDADHYFNPLHYTNKEAFYRNLDEAKKKYKKD